MFAITQAKSTTELNQLNLRVGYFLVKNAGSISLVKRDIVMVGQENLNFKNLSRFKVFGNITTISSSYILSIDGYIFKSRDDSCDIPNIAESF